MQRRGIDSQPGPRPSYEIPGLEFAGLIDKIGPGVAGWQAGDRVCGPLGGGGGYAEQDVIHERLLIPMPQAISFAEATAIPEVFLTAYDAPATEGLAPLHPNWAKAMGARTFVTLGSEEKARKARELGAGRAILYKSEALDQVVLAETDGRGADVIIDFTVRPNTRSI